MDKIIVDDGFIRAVEDLRDALRQLDGLAEKMRDIGDQCGQMARGIERHNALRGLRSEQPVGDQVHEALLGNGEVE